MLGWLIRGCRAEVELEDEEELATFTLFCKCLDLALVQAVAAEPQEDEAKLIESIVSMIAAQPEGNVTVEADSDEEKAEEAV